LVYGVLITNPSTVLLSKACYYCRIIGYLLCKRR